MPEGPQMVFIKDQLEEFVGQKIIKVEGNAKNIPFEQFKGHTLIEIKTFGKELIFRFDEFALRIHLMLFGKYAINEELNRILRLGMQFEDGNLNFYACECRFIANALDTVYDWSKDVLNASFNKNEAYEKLIQKPKQLICEALLDQEIFAGVGNKIKNEVLFRRQIHPQSEVGAIPEEELKRLVDECVKLSHEYLDWKRGGEEDKWFIYKQKECPRDHIPISQEKIGKSGRSCYFCNRCQRLYLSEGY